jgi:hypothetical protein
MTGFWDLPEEKWELVLDVNRKGAFLTEEVVASSNTTMLIDTAAQPAELAASIAFLSSTTPPSSPACVSPSKVDRSCTDGTGNG